MNVKSKYDPDDSEARQSKKQYMFLGYSNYNSRGGAGLSDGGGMIRSPHYFDAILEKLGLKKKPGRRSEGEKQETR
jgi:hypothetical protein